MKSKQRIILSIIMTILCLIFFVSLSVTATLHFRQLYYYNIEKMGIDKKTNLSEELIRRNYDILIDYNSILGEKELKFSDFSMSEQGKIHFEEVKTIFLTLKIFGILSIPFIIIGGCYLIRRKNYLFLKWNSILGFLLPAFIGGLILLDWENTFIYFHTLFFNNEYWIFDPNTDPIITILPDEFFLQCAEMILILFLLQSCFCGIAYKRLSKRNR